MAGNMDDLTDENKNKGKASDKAKKAANGVKNAAKAAKKMKQAGVAVKLIAALWWLALIIVIIFLLIGAYSFITTLPGMMLDKISETVGGLWDDLCAVFVGNGQYIKDEDQYELSEYLNNMGYDVVGYGFASPEDVKKVDDKSKVDSLSGFIMIGDSWTVGLENLDTVRNSGMKTFAHSGADARYWIDNFGQISGENPKGIIVYLGLNSTTYSEDMKTLLNKLKDTYNDVQIYVLKVPNVSRTVDNGMSPDTWNEQIKDRNNTIQSFCQSNGMSFVDTTQGLIGDDGYLSSTYGSGYHLSPQGYEVFFENIQNQIVNNSTSNDNGDNDDGEVKITSKYLKAYLLADFNTYTGEGDGLSRIVDGVKDWFGSETLRGMLVFDGYGSTESINRKEKTITFKTWNPNGLNITNKDTYTFDLDGWAGRYGKPLEFLLTLHVSTMAPDLAYKLASDSNFNTKVHIGYETVDAWVTTRYLVNEETVNNLKELEKNDDTKYNVIWNIDGLETLEEKIADDGSLSIDKDELDKIQEILESETSSYEAAKNAFNNLNGWNEYFKEVSKQIEDGSICDMASGQNYINAYGLYKVLKDESDMPIDWTVKKEYPNAPDDIGQETIVDISKMKGYMEDAKKKAEKNNENIEFVKDPEYYDDIILDIQSLVSPLNNAVDTEYNELKQKMEEQGNSFNKQDAKTILADTKVALDSITSLLDEVYKNGMGNGNYVDGDFQILNKNTEEAEKIRNQLESALLEIGLTPAAIKQATKLNKPEGGTAIQAVQPHINYVSKAWYRNIYFVLDKNILEMADIQEDEYIKKLKANGGEINFSAYVEKNDTKINLEEYVFQPGEGSNQKDMKGLEGKGDFLISEMRNSTTTQSEQPKKGEINQHTKELFVGSGNNDRNGVNPKPKYYIYDGSKETAQKIEDLKQKVKQQGLEESEIDSIDEDDVYREIDMNKNSLAAFSILENMKTDDADFILRDFKDLLVELNYFKKSDLEDKDVGVLDWIFPAYIPQTWPDSEFEKQNYQYGTYIKYRENILQGTSRAAANLDILELSDSEAWNKLTNGKLSSRPADKEPANRADIQAEVSNKIIPITVKIRTWAGDSGLETTDKEVEIQVNEELKDVWEGFFEDVYNEATDFVINEFGGYRIDGTGYGQVGARSAHEYGAAIDLNWSFNPYGTRAPLTKQEWDNLPETRSKYEIIYSSSKVVEIAHKYTLSWGGDWNTVYDIMHFSFFGDQDRNYLKEKWGNGQATKPDTSNAKNVKSINDVLFIGDQFIKGLKDSGLLSEDAEIRAENNSTPATWLRKLDSLPTENIKGVTVLLGANDTSQTEQMKELISKLKEKYGNAEIFVQKVFPVAKTYSGAKSKNKEINKYNKEIEEYCEEQENVTFIDTTKGFVDNDGYLVDIATEDGKNLKDGIFDTWISNLKSKILGSTIYAQEAIDFEDQDLITPGVGKVIEVSNKSITIEFTQNNVVKGMTMKISGFDVDDNIKVGDELEKEQKIGKTLKEDILIILKAVNKSVIENVEDYMPSPEYEIEDENKNVDGDKYIFSLEGTVFSEDEWIAAVEAYCNRIGGSTLSNYNTHFKPVIHEYYNYCISRGVNPELAFVTAICETGLSGGGVNNFYGTATPNGASSPSRSSLMADTEIYCDAILEFQDPLCLKYGLIMQYNEERMACTDNGGVDPNGYGTPDTIQGMQSLYSDLGKHEYGSAGLGGYYYMDPARAGVTKIYATHEEFVTKCQNVGGEHAAGTNVTIWENGQYTAWQVEKKVEIARAIWGDRAGTY